MFGPMDPHTLKVIHDDKVRELERYIEMTRVAKERGEYQPRGAFAQARDWAAQASQWMQAKVLHRAPVTQPESLQEPC